MKRKVSEKIKSGYPVSYAQRRMWFLSRLESEGLVNNSSIKAWLTGELDLENFKKSIQFLVERHEAFRTNFFQTGEGEIIQVVNPFKRLSIDFHDLRSLSRKDARKMLKKLEADNTKHYFDLAHDRLIRVSLIRMSDYDYIFLMTLHHIVSDAWTLAFFWNELSTVYENLCKKEKIKLPSLTVQYKDYAVWEQSPAYLKQFSLQKKYWQKILRQAPAFTRLPLDFPRPTVQTYNHGTYVLHLQRDLVNSIEKICQKLNITNYTFLLACFFIFLHKINNDEDLVVGTYVANRDQAEMERVAGTLLNNIALRAFPKPAKSLPDFIQEVNRTVLSAMNNKEYPFEKLIEDLKIERAASHAPLFNIVFQVFIHDSNFLEKTFSGFKKKTDIFNSDFFQHDLIFRIGISEKKFGFDLNYNKDLFSRETASELARLFQKTIEKSCKCLNSNIKDIKLFSTAQSECWNERLLKNVSDLLPVENSRKEISLEQKFIEEQIMDIWQEVLSLDKVSPEDDFFRLGGHSLKLIQVYDRLDKIFPGRITIAELFNYYTVSSLAKHLFAQKNPSPKNKKLGSRQAFGDLLEDVKKDRISVDAAVDRLWDI